MTDKDLSYKLSLYVDGALPDGEARSLEQYIAAHPEVAQELRELKMMKLMLGEREKVRPNIGFWTRLNATLDDLKEEENNLLPFPRKLVPAVLSLGVVSMIAVGVILFQEREQVLSFLSEKSEAVQQAYENNFWRGTVTPLLSHLDEDNVLQFALFGTLPLGDEAETALRVDETTEKGYTIQMGTSRKEEGEAEGQPKAKLASLTLKDFYKAIQPTRQQEVMIDSVLRLTQKQLVASVFMAEDEALAIDPGLPKLGRMTVSSIAACLEQPQRTRFEKLLNAHNAPYTVVQTVTQRDTKRRVEQVFAKFQEVQRPEKFMIVTPDTFMLRSLAIDVDSVRENTSTLTRPSRTDFGRLTRQFNRFKNDQQVVVSGTQPMKVRTGDGFFRVEIGVSSIPEPPTDDIIQIVKPRYQRPNVYFFQNQTSGGMMEFHVVDSTPYTAGQLDSMLMQVRIGKVKSYGPKLDSLMRRIEEQRAKVQPRDQE